jgi:tetratricopeptide (TPR) repeat protein
VNTKTTANDLSRQGQKVYANKAYIEAAELFMQAARAYAEAGLVLEAAEAANNGSVAALMAGDADAALSAVDGTEAVFAEAGDIKRQGMALGNLAAAYEALGKFDEAMLNYEFASDLLEQAGESELRLHVMQKLSALQLKSGQQISALYTMRSGLNKLENPNPKQRFLKKLLKLPDQFLKG